MSLFDTVVKIDPEQIAKIVQQKWGVTLGKLIKGSQNHTFEGVIKTQQSERKVSIRVTPDLQGKKLTRIQSQLKFVEFISKHNLKHICKPINIKGSNETIFYNQNVIISVFQWAKGQLLNFVQFEWMKNKQIVFIWGKFFAELHKLSRQFEKEDPQTFQKIQNWNQMHHGVLADTKLHSDDECALKDSQHFGVLHGDLNCSNFFFQKQQKCLYVFDTDQVQKGFFLWDVSQAVFTSYMLQKCGMPISRQPVPEANWKQFQSWIIEGYESVAGKGWVNVERLQRMVLLKEQFYLKFCTRAVKQGNIPADMKPFIQYIANTLGSQPKNEEVK